MTLFCHYHNKFIICNWWISFVSRYTNEFFMVLSRNFSVLLQLLTLTSTKMRRKLGEIANWSQQSTMDRKSNQSSTYWHIPYSSFLQITYYLKPVLIAAIALHIRTQGTIEMLWGDGARYCDSDCCQVCSWGETNN